MQQATFQAPRQSFFGRCAALLASAVFSVAVIGSATVGMTWEATAGDAAAVSVTTAAVAARG